MTFQTRQGIPIGDTLQVGVQGFWVVYSHLQQGHILGTVGRYPNRIWSFIPKALRTHVLRCFGPKSMDSRAFGLF